MKISTYNIRGTQMNKIQFSEIESYLEDKGIDANNAFNILADEFEYVYISNGFVSGLKSSANSEGEWHHFFKKELDGTFTAGKFFFN